MLMACPDYSFANLYWKRRETVRNNFVQFTASSSITGYSKSHQQSNQKRSYTFKSTAVHYELITKYIQSATDAL